MLDLCLKLCFIFILIKIYMTRPLTVWFNIIIVCRQISFSVKFDTVKLGWSIVYFKGSQYIIAKHLLHVFLW